jgi:hypothetical protein
VTFSLLSLRSALFQTGRAEAVSVVLGGSPPVTVQAVRYDKSAEPAFDTSTFRRVRFELQFADLASAPLKGDTVTDDTTAWEVIEIEERPEAASWIVTVEEPSV